MTNIFLKAGVITATILLLGMLIGYWLDEQRASSLTNSIEDLNVKYMDAVLQTKYIENFKTNEYFCSASVNKTIELIKNAIKQGVLLERYEKVNRFSSRLLMEKRKYATILMNLWFNAIKLRSICKDNYTTIAYFYTYHTKSLKEKTEQDIQSKVLIQLQKKCKKNEILIFALPVDLNITTIDLLKNQYNITSTPTTLINERWVFKGTTNYKELINYTTCDLNGAK